MQTEGESPVSAALTYAIGDVHGRLDLLRTAARRIVAHSEGRSSRIVFLGDYIDRGPSSRGVIEFMMRASEFGVVCLKGNHEEMMVQSVLRRDEVDVRQWVQNGGAETLRSYGGVGSGAPEDLDLVPESHLAWLDGLPPLAIDEHRIFVHAGLMPGVPLNEQDEETCLWIRERFLRADRPTDFPDGKHIVHGHTPEWAGKPDVRKPELLALRTNLDTGAFATGILTVGVFAHDEPGGPVEVMSIRG